MADMMNNTWTMNSLFSWAYEGVDHNIDGTGGLECVNFLHISQRILETLFAALLACFEMWYAYPRLEMPQTVMKEKNTKTKRILLVVLSLTFGAELGFKFATRQFIWIFNPCHLVTIIQIYLLAAPPSKLVTSVFRLHMYAFHGATLAMLLPVTNTRLLPCETQIYYIQHILMLTVPYFLMREGGPYITESLSDIYWPMMALGVLFLWHFVPLQYVAYVSHVNLNNMLCPAISDPFYGAYYRLVAMAHQTAMIPLHGKVYIFIAKLFLPKLPQECDRQLNGQGVANVGNGQGMGNMGNIGNGHVKAH